MARRLSKDRPIEFRFWTRVCDFLEWAGCGLGSPAWNWALGKAGECIDWGPCPPDDDSGDGSW